MRKEDWEKVQKALGETKWVYAIYPFDASGRIAGVYVGCTGDVKRRIELHLCNKSPKDKQAELHQMMRENGFFYQVLDMWKGGYYMDYCEYDWIEFFKVSGANVFNFKENEHADHTRCSRGKEHPIWTGGGVLWQLSTS